NVVHNLHAFAWGEHEVKPFDWGVRFEKQIKELIKNNKESELADYLKMGDDALMSVPTPDHYLPLLYVMALRQKNEPVTYPVEGFDGGSISMLSVKLG
nr:4,5-DOPA dioxygenase extradiol [Candidatus Goldiibacteriota bacterium]